MPTERNHIVNNNNNNYGRPLVPALASTRTVKSPITPRLATAAVALPSAGSSARRADNNDAVSPNKSPGKADFSTPIKPYLSSNITPRSSSRKSRVGAGSANSTPNGTPTGPTAPRPFVSRDQRPGMSGKDNASGTSSLASSRPESMVSGGDGPGISAAPRLAAAFSHGQGQARTAKMEESPMFFHANEVRSQEQPAPAPKKAATFFFANGEQDDSAQSSPVVTSSPTSMSDEARPRPHVSRPDTSNSHKSAPEEAVLGADVMQHPLLRPSSPAKDNIHLSYRKGASQIIRSGLQRPSTISLPPPAPSQQDARLERDLRRSSVSSVTSQSKHGKTPSLSSIDSVFPPRKILSLPPERISSPATSQASGDGNSAPKISSPEALQGRAAPDIPNLPTSPSKPQSPTAVPWQAGASGTQTISELAANARRERKVMDLEISNSSLLAINRQLEREVKKQKAELRRFRRLSLAGRLSVGAPARPSLGESSVGGDDDLDALPEEDEEDDARADEDDEDADDDSASSSSAGAESSVSEQARGDARRLARDERRLRLDLSRHRELLVDSQRMNQSLKRCLDWTEELIREGRKALSYSVRVSDVRLGGRVLGAEVAGGGGLDGEEADENGDEGGGLVSPSGGALLSVWTPPAVERPVFDLVKTDGDSGVEVDGAENGKEALTESQRRLVDEILGDTF